jgi:FAD/FMN-containing dehydrogenase
MTNLHNNNQSRRQFLRQTLLSAGGLLLTSVASALSEVGSTGLDAGELDRTLGAFGKSIQGNVLLASDANYDGMRRTLSFNPLTDKYPAIIAQCKTADDVARSIEFARANSLEIAVRSGGCDVMGQSVCQGGMLVDLSLLQEIELRVEDRTVRMGAGVRCGALEYKLSDAGVVVPLACNPMVGVSGLTLGGGLGWVSGKHGMTADNVVAMEIITADGIQLRVSDKQNQDLFWALRGGGGNFGIVTAFEYQVYQLTEVYGGFLLYPIEMLGEYLQFYRDIMADAPDELMIELSISPTNPPMLVATVCYSGDETSLQAVLSSVRQFGPPVFDGMRAAKLSQLTAFTKKVTDFIMANSKPDAGSPIESDGHYNHWRGATIPEWTDSAINTFVTSIEKAPAGWSIGVGHYMHGASCAVSAQATPILRDEHSSSYFFNMSWGHSSQSDDSMAWVDRSIKDMQPFNRAGTYINYLSSNAPEAVADSYGTNYPRLRKLKSQYDSENIFHLNRNIRA